jgi:hypothetical protein
MSKHGKFPAQVLRFYGNADFAIDTIGAREITLVSTSLLNDPFDPYFFFETDFGEDYSMLVDYVRAKYPDDFGWFLNEMTLDWWKTSVPKLKKYLFDLKQSLYVFSTSGVYDQDHPRDNLYMWGHYANGHRGVAIEFSTVEIGQEHVNNYNTEHRESLQAKDAWQAVDYQQKLPVLTRAMLFDFAKAEHFKDSRQTLLDGFYEIIAQTKSLDWRSENEWRLLWRRDDTKRKTIRIQINDKAIECVYIGLNTSSSVESDVVFETRQKYPSARIYKTEKRQGAFALDFKQIV